MHPMSHGRFIDISLDDDSDDDEAEDTQTEDEEVGPGEGAEGEEDDPPDAAIDPGWRWEFDDGGELVLRESGTA